MADNYHARMAGAVRGAAASLGLGTEAGQLQLCPQLNISQCPATAGLATQLTVNLYNPLAWRRRSAVGLPVTSGQYHVTSWCSSPPKVAVLWHKLVFLARAGPLDINLFTIPLHLALEV